MTDPFPPTRQAALARLHAFIPRMGRIYAHGRNTDAGPDGRQDVSMLSPYLRRRLITEAEVVRAAIDAHGEAAEKFIQEVVWRTYHKGWLEQHPETWANYLREVRHGENRLATESGLRRVYHDACEGRTGIDGFDDWARELVARGWLHNHARMWFASIWIFTLRLPWALGAAFFLRHLLDGDPASNTLGWRWVAGLHTRGKHYIARADNIARYTNGRFNPNGQLNETPEPLQESFVPDRVRLAEPGVMPTGPFVWLMHDEDLSLHLPDAREVAVVSCPSGAGPVQTFTTSAVDDAVTRLGRPVTSLEPGQVGEWVRAQTLPVVAAWAPIGPTATLLDGLGIIRLRDAWDSAIWPHATRGFFQVKAKLPELLPRLVA
jgi:deoxyribodipyrimidine photo-lyase